MADRGRELRASRVWTVAVLVALALALAAAPATASAMETLVEQAPTPASVGVPSDKGPEPSQIWEDFDVRPREHWRLEALQVFGTAAIDRPRTFKVEIGYGGNNSPIPESQFFTENVTVDGGPNYVIPLTGVPTLEHGPDFDTGEYWFTVQAVSAGGEDDWYWLTGPDTAGNQPAYRRVASERVPAGAEPGQAFGLLGTRVQIVRVQTAGAGTLVSDPPGISCSGRCVAEIPRGTRLTFTPLPPAGARFTEWGFRNTGYSGPSNALSPVVIPSPCSGTAGCSFTLTEDTNVGAVFEPIDEATALEVVRDRKTGKGELVVSVPGTGWLTMVSPGLRTYVVGQVAAGVVHIPLVPRKRIAKALRKRGHATVSVEVGFRATAAPSPGLLRMPVTLVRKGQRRPSR
jgi:hypothetical protein